MTYLVNHKTFPDTAATTLVFENDTTLMKTVLKPYKSHCHYLRSSEVLKTHNRVSAVSEFSIPESCYIDDTGHFNSVEFNICYNQMMYYSIAKSVKEGVMPEFKQWALSDFWSKQLPDILITRFSSKFKRPINARKFYAAIEYERSLVSRKKDPTLFLKTTCKFWDDQHGLAEGNIDLAVVNTIL